MTKIEFEIAKQHEAELLQALRMASIIKSKLMRTIDGGDGTLLDIEYNEKKNCLRYVMEGGEKCRRYYIFDILKVYDFC